ncbi:competence protein ComG [Bacillus sp. M6-12]|uniref:competence type IV pilus minor pilin ComGD n=1 Tax=Bacillus sp. M6-12 TaxID=2054166 RepID=UPI000C782463|nr:competence type IV pilus minor pilin ComGD [Bacillus sp. M6-12]PLS15256.1 competence protein ComG [Bacillus sp. M6-12]
MPQLHRLIPYQGKGQKGFTLSEILIVLSIFIMLFTLSSSLYPHFIREYRLKLFLNQLSTDLLYAHQYAISHQVHVSVIIDKNTRRYLVQSYLDGTLLQRDIPKGINIKRGTLDFIVYFTSTGSVSQSGTWIIYDERSTYNMILNFGQGRFRFEKV